MITNAHGQSKFSMQAIQTFLKYYREVLARYSDINHNEFLVPKL